jgi:hypothetical protein
MRPFETCRDVLVLRPENEAGNWLVTAVDSCGAIGEKPGDALRVPPELAAEYTARVALLEVKCTGADPVFATLNVCNEPETGDRLLAGFRQALRQLPVVMSTEKNMPTSMSAFGVSVTGMCHPDALRLGRAAAGDRLFCAGLPLCGEEVLSPHAVLFSPMHLDSLFADSCVHAAIPCGSSGILKEARILAAESSLTAVIDPRPGLDLEKSAGPASCAVFAAAVPDGHDFGLGLPVACIGRLCYTVSG